MDKQPRIEADIAAIQIIDGLKVALAAANARDEAALKMLDEKNCPRKYVKHGGVLYCLHGSSSISAYESLQSRLREVAELLKESLTAIEEIHTDNCSGWCGYRELRGKLRAALDLNAIVKE